MDHATAILVGIAFLGLGVAWLWHSRSNTKGRVFGGMMLLLSVPFGFTLGHYFAEIQTDVCYSNAIESIYTVAQQAIDSKDPHAAELFAAMRKEVPLSGFETRCDAVLGVAEGYEARVTSQE
jgi:hypothetical protein